MKYTFVAIGDLHFQDNPNNNLFDKLDSFVEVILSQLSQNSECVFLVNGDIANKGKSTEYTRAINYFSELNEKILVKFKIKISYIFTSGNHDCDLDTFKEEDYVYRDEIRKKMFQHIPLDHKELEFFNKHLGYFEIFCNEFKNKNIKKQNHYFSLYEYKNDGFPISVVGFNSGMFYDKKFKEQGLILADSEFLFENLMFSSNEIVLSMTHYPLEWYNRHDPSYYRAIYDLSSLVITSHEHVDSKNSFNNKEVKLSFFSDDKRSALSEVTIINIDTKSADCSVLTYNYSKNGYTLVDTNRKNLSISTLFIGDSRLPIIKSYYDEFQKPNSLLIDFSELSSFESIYVSPYINIYNDEFGTKPKRYRADKIQWKKNDELLVIISDRNFGKTTVLKKIFLDLMRSGELVLFIQATNRYPTKDSIEKAIVSTFGSEYLSFFANRHEQVTLLIDDIDNYNNQLSSRIQELYDMGFVNIIATADINKFDTIRVEYSKKITKCHILRFGNVQRYEYIDNWLSKVKKLSGKEKDTEVSKINSIIKKVGSIDSSLNSPDLITVFLEAYDQGEQYKIVNGSIGAYYDYLIKKHELKLQNMCQVSSAYIETYFHEMAYFIHENSFYDEAKFNKYYLEIYPENESTYYLTIQRIKEAMEKNRLLDKEDIDTNYFLHSYMYSYYCAKHLQYDFSTKLDKVQQLINNVSEDDNMKILLFLFHFTKETKLVEMIIDKGDSIFKMFDNFGIEELGFINSFIKGIRNSVYRGDIKTNNQEINEKLDLLDDEDSPKKGNLDLTHLSPLQINYIESNYTSQIILEFLNQKIVKSTLKKLLDCSLDIKLRSLSFIVYALYKDIQSILKLDDDKAEKTYNVIVPMGISSILLSLIELFEHLTPSNYADYVGLYLSERNQCEVIKVIRTLLPLTTMKDKKTPLTTREMDEMVKLRDNLFDENNYILAALINAIVDLEINFIGMPDQTSRVLFEKMNARDFGLKTDDVPKQMDIDSRNKNKRIKR